MLGSIRQLESGRFQWECGACQQRGSERESEADIALFDHREHEHLAKLPIGTDVRVRDGHGVPVTGRLVEHGDGWFRFASHDGREAHCGYDNLTVL